METQGTDVDSLRHHVGIQPLFVIFGGAMILISAFVSLVNRVGGRGVMMMFGYIGGEEVSLRQWHQLDQDQGLGGKIEQEKKNEQKF